MSRWKRVAAWLVAAMAASGAALGAAVVYFGWYDVSATGPHTVPVHALLDVALTRSVKVRSADIDVPDLDSPTRIQRGDALFRAHCVQCHGAPGQAPEPYALGMNPAPASLVGSARERPAAEMFWITRHGIKMTGMPAWQYRLTDEQIWDVVAFMRVLPTLSPEQYRDLAQSEPRASEAAAIPGSIEGPGEGPSEAPRVGDAMAGRDALQQYLCVTCHAIPGVPGARHHVGPSLAGIGDRSRIAGVLPNTPDNMRQWLLDPQQIKPGSAMPALGLREQDARDIAAFLQTLSRFE
ncbi:MAG: c-type cytochrome [Achromobacter sp.]|uniref:c-type cytochrome n=1 Tax=Achromobacter sp. TaxID=134375 RepID=UPI003CFF8C80